MIRQLSNIRTALILIIFFTSPLLYSGKKQEYSIKKGTGRINRYGIPKYSLIILKGNNPIYSTTFGYPIHSCRWKESHLLRIKLENNDLYKIEIKK